MRDTAEVVTAGLEIAADELLQSLTQIITKPGAVMDANIDPRLLGHSCSAAILLGLSIEIGLKNLLLKSNEKQIFTHDHVKIFKKLPEDIKSKLKQNFDIKLAYYNQNNAGKIHATLHDSLNISKHLFEGWRYLYEQQKRLPKFNARASKFIIQSILETLEEIQSLT